MPSKKVFKKRVHTKRHFKRRFYERYHLELSVSDVRELEERIKRKDRCVLVENLTHTKSMWDVEIDGVWYTIIYSKKHKTPITVYYGDDDLQDW